MRDLAVLPAGAFDIVYQPYALNFVPEADAVFREVARVLRPGGRYYLQCANPFSIGVGRGIGTARATRCGNPTRRAGRSVTQTRTGSTAGARGKRPGIPAPREYRHTLGTIVNELAGRGFVLRHLEEFKDMSPDPGAEPGSWQHLTAVAPPWLALWWDYRPDLLAQAGGDD